MLTIRKLTVHVEGSNVLKDVSLTVRRGEIDAVMGPNGSGKSSLAYAIAGHPRYTVTSGSMTFQGKNLLRLQPEERARLGIFLSFQEPPEVGGVTLEAFLGAIAKKQPGLSTVSETKASDADRRRQYKETGLALQRVHEMLPRLHLAERMLDRPLNEGFSGGEKKKGELLQLLALKPRLAILDEIDSGLDMDSLKAIAGALKNAVKDGMGLVVISHYTKIFRALKANKVHVLRDGHMVREGTMALLNILEKDGYGRQAS